MLASQPKVSTTLTQAVYPPGLAYLNPASFTVFKLRSLQVRVVRAVDRGFAHQHLLLTKIRGRQLNRINGLVAFQAES